MIRIRRGKVLCLLSSNHDVSTIKVKVDGIEEKAINYNLLTGAVKPGDEVVLNTTAVYKKLGTGGAHFVMANLTQEQKEAAEAGHIMKTRYTPCQVKVLAIEEQEHPENYLFQQTRSLAGTPVVIGSLHSMLAPVTAVIHYLTRGQARVVYLMTDGAALPLALSNLAAELKEKKLIAATVTCGQAFGGDYEAVTKYSGLLAAFGVAKADIIVAIMGPGITGTASEFGFTGVEQGELVNAVNILGGCPIATPRISFADNRTRHKGISHHTHTALGRIALNPCVIPVPVMEPEKERYVWQQIKENNLEEKHQVIKIEAAITLKIMEKYGLRVTTMGRSIDQDREFFMAAGAAGIYAARQYLKESKAKNEGSVDS
jgi:hypothetical protein